MLRQGALPCGCLPAHITAEGFVACVIITRVVHQADLLWKLYPAQITPEAFLACVESCVAVYHFGLSGRLDAFPHRSHLNARAPVWRRVSCVSLDFHMNAEPYTRAKRCLRVYDSTISVSSRSGHSWDQHLERSRDLRSEVPKYRAEGGVQGSVLDQLP